MQAGYGGGYATGSALYATILTAGCMVSRGPAKSGSQEPYRDED